MLKFLLCSCICASLVFVVQAKSEAEIKAWFMEFGLACAKDHPLPIEDMQNLHKHILPNNKEAKCFLACVYRKAKWMDDKGMFDIKAAHAFAEKDVDSKKLENGKKLYELCAKVNDESVSDGEKGCDRAGYLFNCLTQNAAKYGFDIV